MRLSEIELLSAEYSSDDVSELVAVIQSTRLSSPSAILRWGKMSSADFEKWARESCTSDLKRGFQLKRISNIQSQLTLPSVPLAEYLVVRDADLIRLGTDSNRSPQGRIVAHADYLYTPSYGNCDSDAENNEAALDSSVSYPDGFNFGLYLQINRLVEKTLTTLFSGLPCFTLCNISTLTPSHLRKGIAKRLTEWIFPYADQLALPVILCASPVGLPLYQKCGFVEYRQYDVVVELEAWGGEGFHKHVVMVRWPTSIENLSETWKKWIETHGLPSDRSIERTVGKGMASD